MDNLQVKAILAGMFFGIWPLFMNRSGLTGNVSSVMFCMAVLIGVSPFAIYSNGLSIPTANWTMVALAGFFGAIGLLSFNSMLSNATPQNVGTLFVFMIVVQIVVPALYQTIMDGNISIRKIGGYTAAITAAFLLSK
ncbi:MAG: hypothetical protein HGB08_03870 [Candidatus Moranbacteria bacterium]|nr:hypothetical protein [Candidatus Moranbacteria bacterium]